MGPLVRAEMLLLLLEREMRRRQGDGSVGASRSGWFAAAAGT